MTEAEILQYANEIRTLRGTVGTITFADVDKEHFRSELIAITDSLLAVNVPTDYSPFTEEEYASCITVCWDWLRQLVDSNAYRLNEEMSYCVLKTIENWDQQQAQRIVVFTLGEFAVHKIRRNVNTHRIDYLLIMAQNTGVNLTKEPVFIRVPDRFKYHILTNVPLFHEVGHLIDFNNSISERVLAELLPLLSGNRYSRFKREFFPDYDGVDINTIPDANTVLLSHVEEYIADVFGAQFAGLQILCYASYIEAKSANRSTKDHPSYNCRKRLVESFVNQGQPGVRSNSLLNAILRYLPTLRVYNCPFTEEELLDPGLRFVDIDEMLSSISKPWPFIIRESKRNRIRREGVANFNQMIALPIFGSFDNNMRRAIREYMNRP